MRGSQIWALPRRQRLASPRACCSSCRTQRPAAASAGGKQLAGSRGNQDSSLWSTVSWLVDHLESLGAGYMFTGAASAWLQGAQVQHEQLRPLQVSLQWDFMMDLHGMLSHPVMPRESSTAGNSHSNQHAEHALVQNCTSEMLQSQGGRLSFTASVFDNSVLVSCELNRVLHMNPDRVPVTCWGKRIWCESLLSVRDSTSKTDPTLSELVVERLQELQVQLTSANAMAWSQAETADAWGVKLGNPEQAAAWLQEDPLLRLGSSIHKHLPNLSGTNLINLMGSNGTKAVAAALLGAEVTCVDISPSNAQYGRQLAQAAGVDVEFVAADVLALPDKILTGGYDVVLLEMGILHYFIDLQPLMQVIHQLLVPGGIMLLREFHPISTKLITSKGKKHKVTGDYFSQQLVSAEVAYSKYAVAASAQGSSSTAMTVQLRQWGLGEVVTSVAEAGMVLRRLEEEPGVKSADAGLPKIFTLVALKPSQ